MHRGSSAGWESVAGQRPRPALASAVQSAGTSPQGVILVYDIANRWSFDGIDRWIKEIDEVRLGALQPPQCGLEGVGPGHVGLGTRLQQQGGCVTCQHGLSPWCGGPPSQAVRALHVVRSLSLPCCGRVG